MREIAAFLFILGVGNFCWGTEQIDDVLFINGQQYHINEIPLSSKFDYDRLQEILDPQLCSASWRGYKAEWFIRDRLLWLSRIIKNPCGDEAEHVEAGMLFPGQEYPIKAVWYSGEIGLAVGEREYVQGASPKDSLGYKIDTFIFQIKNGLLIKKGVVAKEHVYKKP